jgi:hypothetical protein
VDAFFLLIILGVLVPVAIRLFRRSGRGQNQNQDITGQYPGPPNNQNNQFRDGYTQRDYYGAFGAFDQPGNQPGNASANPPGNQWNQGQYGPPQVPPFQGPHGYQTQGQAGPGGYPAPGQPGQVPFEDSPEYREWLSRQQPRQPAAPETPAPPSAPQGYRARKLAELDQQYSNGEIAMEEYMARRAEIMKG